MCTNKILECIKLFAEKEQISEYSMAIMGTTKKGDGYFSKIISIRLNGKTTSEEAKIWNLVLKISATNSAVRAILHIKSVFEKEFYIYNTVVPTFKKFEKEVGKVQSMDYIPFCYATEFLENCEILIFENLTSRGFSMWDRKKPMTCDHVELVLEAYGRWHAISLAMRKKQPENFEKLAKTKIHMFHYLLLVMGADAVCQQFGELCNSLESEPEVKKLHFGKSELEYIFMDLFAEDPDYHVILHGDCWTNNFMFRTEEESNRPIDVKIIDWQCSALGSPIMDISYFLYACMDTEINTDVKEMLKVYYHSLDEHLKHLQCDSSEIFPFDKVVEHWRRFSKYGLMLGTHLINLSLREKDEIFDVAEFIESGRTCHENLSAEFANQEVYLKRGRSNILHYLRNLD